MRLFIPIAAVVIMAGCAPPKMTVEERENVCGYQPDQGQAEVAVQGWVDHGGLKDPSSAQVRDIQVLSRGGIQNGLLNGGEWRYGWIISFECNAKNSYGAYIGFRRRYLIWNKGQTWWLNSVTGDDPRAPSPM